VIALCQLLCGFFHVRVCVCILLSVAGDDGTRCGCCYEARRRKRIRFVVVCTCVCLCLCVSVVLTTTTTTTV